MKNTTRTLLLAAFGLAAIPVSSPAQQPTLQPIAGAELALGMSRDGRAVVGRIAGPPTEQAFRWQGGALLPLGYLSGGTRSEARAVSLTGAVVVGTGNSTDGFRAFRWTATGGMEDLGVLPGDSWSRALGVSDDGVTIVGDSGFQPHRAFRLTPAGMIDLGTLPGGGSGGTGSTATGVSADGSVVVGSSYSSFGYRPFRWTEAGMADLGGLGALNQGDALAVSADGTAVVGYLEDGASSLNNRAFRWTVGAGMENLGTLPGGLDSYASGVNADGTIVTGRTALTGGFVWTPTDGMVPAAAYLAARGIDTTGWTIYEVSAVSAAGSAFTGHGRGPSGALTYWWVGLGCPRLDFEREDDFTTALVNGQHVDTEFGEVVSLTSSGANAGLAIFDSTPGGPNDPSQDPDLLVDTGNVLILQTENFPPDANDVFPRPNDDEDGGTITFDFMAPLGPASLRLIDLDAGDGTTTVVLTDGAARTRTFTVPSNWTGDLTLGQSGQRVLDLTTLAPQPGFASLATAGEDAGFDPAGVVQLAVQLEGSGAIDDFAWCSPSLPRALAVERNGSGTNTLRLRSLSLPVLGRVWNAELDCAAFGSGVATLDVRAAALGGRPTPFGELLIAGPLVQRTVGPFAGSARTLGWNLPNDPALCGLELHAQGLCAGSSFARGKTLRMHAGLSNAIDLVLGF